MKIESKLNKIYAGAIAIMMITIVFSSVFAVRTITDSSDTIATMITNSKGNSWSATLTNVNLAIWDLNSTKGGTVWLPGTTLTGAGTGTGEYSYGILMCSNVVLKGAGMNSTTLKLSTGSLVQAVVYFRNINNYTISDLSIDGFNDTTSNNYQAIFTIGCKYGFYNNIHIKNMFRSNFQFGDSIVATESKYCKISNIWIDYGRDSFPSVYQSMSGAHVNYSTFENIHIHGDGSNSVKGVWGMDWVRTSWNRFTDIYIDGVGFGCKWFATGNHNITVNNMDIRGCVNVSDCQIWLYAIRDSSFSNVNIENKYQGIQCSSAGPNLNFNNIIIRGGADAGIYASGDFINFNNVQIYSTVSSGLYLYGCDDSKFSNIEVKGCSNGVYFENGDRDTFVNCKFQSNTNYGIVAKACTLFTIVGCIFQSNGIDGIDTTITSCNNYSISSCIFNANAKAIDLNAADNYFTIQGSICQIGDGIDINAALSVTRRVNDTICVLTVS